MVGILIGHHHGGLTIEVLDSELGLDDAAASQTTGQGRRSYSPDTASKDGIVLSLRCAIFYYVVRQTPDIGVGIHGMQIGYPSMRELEAVLNGGNQPTQPHIPLCPTVMKRGLDYQDDKRNNISLDPWNLMFIADQPDNSVYQILSIRSSALGEIGAEELGAKAVTCGSKLFDVDLYSVDSRWNFYDHLLGLNELLFDSLEPTHPSHVNIRQINVGGCSRHPQTPLDIVGSRSSAVSVWPPLVSVSETKSDRLISMV
ncbi:hypothetical protein BGZ61DRAFT_484209 [Ilyonectria robusta]|uniref:uncharacterized protein n=1 Tax=Ilyonectria robusta TaxID=1079257 RepID=UPI001E8ED618|nr:uncharacterized protein BGZ61DRAFT_484209 [Ilyonectria robusta]KAH8665493.1 hypothetical protein BGZ61DRAFT_484209 [Ilyonectria robusta]